MMFARFQATRLSTPLPRAQAIAIVGEGILHDDTVAIHTYRDPEDEMVFLEELKDGSFYMIFGFEEAEGDFDTVEVSLYNAACAR